MQWLRQPATKYIVLFVVLVLLAFLSVKKRRRIISYIREKTWDIVSDRRIARLHPAIRDKAKAFIIRAEKELGIRLRVVSGMRSWAEQAELYAQGRTRAGAVVTNAKPGDSLHNYGLALDVVEIRDGLAVWNSPNWHRIAALGKSIGFSWGGDWRTFKDKPHFEMRFGYSLAQLKRLYKSGRRDGEYVKLSGNLA